MRVSAATGAIHKDDCPCGYCVERMECGCDYCVDKAKRADATFAAERRRYALLDAAIVMYWAGVHGNVDDWTYRQAVCEAQKILIEVEALEQK